MKGEDNGVADDPPELLSPIEDFAHKLEPLPTSNIFPTGHRIATNIISSNFPICDRSPNAGHSQGMDSELHAAHLTMFHDSARPSHVTLPMVR